MKLTDGEKLILLMLSEIKKELNVENGVDPDFVESAIYGGYTWAFNRQLKGIPFEHEDTPPKVREVIEILDMWSWLVEDFKKLSPEDRERVKIEAKLRTDEIHFPGFDGNHESEQLGIAHFLTENMGMFEKLKGHIANSHYPAMDQYHSMLPAFEQARKAANPLTAQGIINILAAFQPTGDC
jgi:uncharacterized protein